MIKQTHYLKINIIIDFGCSYYYNIIIEVEIHKSYQYTLQLL